jgi:hypothetical protein
MHVLSWAVDKDGRTRGGFCASLSVRVTYGLRTYICSYSHLIFFSNFFLDFYQGIFCSHECLSVIYRNFGKIYKFSRP